MAGTISIIAPVFLVIALGFGLGRTALFRQGDAQVLITFVWYVGIPALIFGFIAPRPLPGGTELMLAAAFYLSLYSVYFLAMALAKLLFRLSLGEQGIFALATCFANGAFLGVPIMEAAYGPEGVRLLLILLSFHSLTLLPITTVVVESAGGGSGAVILRRVLGAIAHNPIMVALAAALVWSALSLPYPLWLNRLVSLPAAAAAPVGLFAAGLALSQVRISGDLPQALTAVFLKLVLLPAAVYGMGTYVFALPATWVGTATVLASLPTGMVAYSFASQYGIAPRRAASTVLLSTILSVVSLTFVLLLLKSGETG